MSEPIKPYKVEVLADSSGVWAGNGLRFESLAEARDYAQNLFMRWTAVRSWRVMQTETSRTIGADGNCVIGWVEVARS